MPRERKGSSPAVSPKSSTYSLFSLLRDIGKKSYSPENDPLFSSAYSNNIHSSSYGPIVRYQTPVLPDQLCEYCTSLDIKVKMETASLNDLFSIVPRWDMPTLMRQSRCPLCRLLLNTLRNCAAINPNTLELVWGRFEGQPPGILDYWPSRRLRIFVDKRLEEMDPTISTTSDINRCIQVHTGKRPQGVYEYSQTRTIDPEQVNFPLVRQWLQTCDTLHTTCHPSTTPDSSGTLSSFQFRVVDVLDGCVVRAPQNCKYIALSYVWGLTPQVILTRRKVRSLSLPGSLWTQTPRVPNSIRDAIHVCGMLGERYLWVDSLCIVQDDITTNDKHTQIIHMDAIYRSAVLTVVAAAGADADAGLPGIRGKVRNPVQEEGSVDGLDMISRVAATKTLLEDSVWYTRGWTFQEYLLSRRLLVFTENQAYFMCRSGQWREDFTLGAFCGTHNDINLGDPIHNPRRSLQRDYANSFDTGCEGMEPLVVFDNIYLPTLNEFIQRTLSRYDDILNALAGVFKALSPSLGPFRFGVPEIFLHAFLPFRIRQSSLPIRRPGFPSWSWAGWMHANHSRLICTRTIDRLRTVENTILGIYGLNDDCNVELLSGRWPTRALKKRIHEKLRAHLNSRSVDAIVSSLGDRLTILDSGHLFFWTSHTSLFVGRDGQQRAFGSITQGAIYPVRSSPGGHVLGYVHLDAEWRRQRPDWLNFILAGFTPLPGGTQRNPAVLPMLIETIEDVSYRIQILQDPAHILQETWMDTNPTRKLIVLG